MCDIFSEGKSIAMKMKADRLVGAVGIEKFASFSGFRGRLPLK